MIWYGKRRTDVSFNGEFREECAGDDIPIAFEPCPDQLHGTDEIQSADVGGVCVEHDPVVLDLGRDVDGMVFGSIGQGADDPLHA